MAGGPIQNLARRIIRSPKLYTLARHAMLIGQYVLRRPDERDFAVLPALAPEAKLVADIGANGGQSAVAFSFLFPSAQIISFEPNPALWPELDFIRKLVGKRFAYRKLGLGDEAGTLELLVPWLGTLPVTTRASLSDEAAADHVERLQRELGQQAEIRKEMVEVVRFDDLALDPDVVKIDVEGFELQVLRGMEQTLKRCHPVLLLEANKDSAQCHAFLKARGYRLSGIDPATHRLGPIDMKGMNNWVALPPGAELPAQN